MFKIIYIDCGMVNCYKLSILALLLLMGLEFNPIYPKEAFKELFITNLVETYFEKQSGIFFLAEGTGQYLRQQGGR